MEVKKINLKKGFIDIYNFGDIKLHCYQTNDFMNNEFKKRCKFCSR